MFSDFMVNTWIASTIVAIVAGLVGFFVVLRGSSFLAHALPHGAFAGAAGAALLGLDPILGMGVFAVGGALTVSTLGRRGRNDVVIALALVVMLAAGALFLSLGGQYSAEVFALLFGQILGVSSAELLPILVLGTVCVVAVIATYRPLLLASVLPEQAAARGIGTFGVSIFFAVLVALATTMSVPIPPLTEDRRKDIVKHLHKVLENHRTALRNVRRDIKEAVDKLEKEKLITIEA